MSWLAIAQKNQDTEIVKLEKKQIRQVQNIDMYPEDLFEIRYIDEIRQLKTQLRRVTEERDILKEAAVYFVVESKKSTRL